MLLRNRVAIILMAVGLLSLPAEAGSPIYDTIALSGTDGKFGPGLAPGVTFSSFRIIDIFESPAVGDG